MRATSQHSAAALLTLAALGGCAGCTMGPNYVRPAVEAPATYRYGESEARAASNVVNVGWWTQFGDPTLDALIAEALAGSKDVQIAAAHVEQAAAALTQARAPLYPQASASADASRVRPSGGNTSPPPQTQLQLLAGASWELDLWGRIRRLSEAARANLFATEEARRGVILSLTAGVASTYIQLLALDEQLTVAERSRDAYRESVRLFELQLRHGQVSQLNVEQARTQYETASVAIPQIRLELVRAENALSTLLGRNPGTIANRGSLDALRPPEIPAGLPSDLLSNRPDLREAEQALVAANAEIGAAKARLFPSISLTGSLGTASAALADLFKGPARTWTWGGSLTAPLFEGGALRSQVRQSEAARQAALLAYEKAVQSAFADAENALAERTLVAEELAAQERLVTAGREYERLSHLLYDGGAAPYSTVLQAQQQLFPSELTLAQTRAAVLTSVVDVYKAMGGGWVALAEQATAPSPAPSITSSAP